MRVLCVSLEANRKTDPWLTLNREYLVLSILVVPGRVTKLRVLTDDNRTPILADAAMFAATSEPLPPNWVATIREGGVLELGPRRWLQLGFWEQYFDGDLNAVATFQDEIQAMTGIPYSPG